MKPDAPIVVLRRCPQCGNEPEDRHKAFGYCGTCGQHSVITNGGGRTYMPVTLAGGGGGIIRCCTEPRHAWALLNPGPWPDGTVMPCMHHGLTSEYGYTHGLVYREADNRWYSRDHAES